MTVNIKSKCVGVNIHMKISVLILTPEKGRLWVRSTRESFSNYILQLEYINSSANHQDMTLKVNNNSHAFSYTKDNLQIII